MDSGQPHDEQLDKTAAETRAALAKLSQEAKRLKQLSELRSLRENPLDVSVDVEGLLSTIQPPPDNSPPPTPF